MLFRVWDKENKKWVKDANITDNGYAFISINTQMEQDWLYTDDVEFNTGITLVDGTEIFFGDIIRRPLPGGTWKSIDQKHFDFYEYILITKENLFEIIHKYTNGNILYDYFELVGNIHETELTDAMKVWIKE